MSKLRSSPASGPLTGHGGASAVLPSLIRRGGTPSGAAALLARGGMEASAPIFTIPVPNYGYLVLALPYFSGKVPIMR